MLGYNLVGSKTRLFDIPGREMKSCLNRNTWEEVCFSHLDPVRDDIRFDFYIGKTKCTFVVQNMYYLPPFSDSLCGCVLVSSHDVFLVASDTAQD